MARSLILEAAEGRYPKCPACGAWIGDRCFTESGNYRTPHKERLVLIKAQDEYFATMEKRRNNNSGLD